MLSTDASTAFSVSTSITRWLPPLRSSPRAILGTLFFHHSGRLGESGVDGRNRNSATTTERKISASLHWMLFFMEQPPDMGICVNASMRTCEFIRIYASSHPLIYSLPASSSVTTAPTELRVIFTLTPSAILTVSVLGV